MSTGIPDNVLLVHCHDLGRSLGVYGTRGVSSPQLNRLAAQGILFTRAHATAPLCSPSRGSLFTGRYPHSNGLIGLAHHGWEYRAGIATLPQILSGAGYSSALFGMQHETSQPARLGFDEFDVSNSYCEYVVPRAQQWLTRSTGPDRPFLLTAGFFETHRPYPPERYTPADPRGVDVPHSLPDTLAVRADLADFYGAVAVADAAVGRLLETLDDAGLDANTWVVFLTDHGPAFPRAKSTLYDAGTGIALIVRPPARLGIAPRVYDDLFSGVDLLPTLLEWLGIDEPADVDGVSHARQVLEPAGSAPKRNHVFAEKTYHDSFDPIRAVRTKDHSYIENYADRPMLDLPLDIENSPSGQAVTPHAGGLRPRRELYDLRADPTETTNLLLSDDCAPAEEIADDLATVLREWQESTGDVIPSDAAGTRIALCYKQTHKRMPGMRPASRSPAAAERGVGENTGDAP